MVNFDQMDQGYDYDSDLVITKESILAVCDNLITQTKVKYEKGRRVVLRNCAFT